MKAAKRWTLADHVSGVIYLVVVCLGIAIASATTPSSIFLVASASFFVMTTTRQEEWIRKFSPFAGAMTIGFLLVWIAAIFLKFNTPNVDSDKLLDVES